MKRRPTTEQLHSMAQENARWPAQLRQVPEIPVGPRGVLPPTKAWRSRQFLVMQFELPGMPIRLSIQRTTLQVDGNWMDEITWDDLQRLKSEAGYGDAFAIECYPEDEHVVNVSNLRHLWLIERPEWAWRNAAGADVPSPSGGQ